MHVTARPFAGAADLQRMLDFIAPLNAHEALSGYIHAGDVLWRVYQNTLFDPFRSIRLWEDGHGSLLGFAWHEAPDGVLMQVAPNLRGTGLLERPMLAWAAAQVDLTPIVMDICGPTHGKRTTRPPLFLFGTASRAATTMR